MLSRTSIAALKCAIRHTLVAFKKKFYPLTPAKFADGAGITGHLVTPPHTHLTGYTRRRLGGRPPLCGTGVTSVIGVILSPVDCNARIAPSPRDSGPCTYA